MKYCLLLALALTVAVAQQLPASGTSLAYRRTGLTGGQQGSAPYYASQRYGYSGRPRYSESYHQETGNLYGGQRDGRYVYRDGADNARGLQYSLRPGSEWSGSRGQYGNAYNSQRFQDGIRRDGYGYGAGRSQISYNAPLANTRSYNTQYDGAGHQNFAY